MWLEDEVSENFGIKFKFARFVLLVSGFVKKVNSWRHTGKPSVYLKIYLCVTIYSCFVFCVWRQRIVLLNKILNGMSREVELEWKQCRSTLNGNTRIYKLVSKTSYTIKPKKAEKFFFAIFYLICFWKFNPFKPIIFVSTSFFPICISNLEVCQFLFVWMKSDASFCFYCNLASEIVYGVHRVLKKFCFCLLQWCISCSLRESGVTDKVCPAPITQHGQSKEITTEQSCNRCW